MIRREEWRWVVVFAVTVMLVTSLPYLFAGTQSGDNQVFTGSLIGVEDGNSYIAKMLRGNAGDWFFTTPYTPYPQTTTVAFIPYLLLGKLASSPGMHEQLVALFHIFRFTAGFLAICSAYFLISVIIQEKRARRLALAVYTLGGGLGWLAVLLNGGSWLGSPPLEWFSPEAFGFLELYSIPHLSVARGLLFCTLAIWLMPEVEASWLRRALLVGILLLLIGTIQPATPAVALYLMGIHLVLLAVMQIRQRWQFLKDAHFVARLQFFLVTAAISGPYLLYSLLHFRADAVLNTWLEQNQLTSPHPLHYLLAYGLVLPFTIAGAVRLWHQGDRVKTLFLLGWLVSLPLLAYAPISIQRRLVVGIWIAIVILAAGLFDTGTVSRWLKWKPVFGLTLPSTIVILAMGIIACLHPSRPIYIPITAARVYNELAAEAKSGDVVLSSYETGNTLPAWAPLRVVIGHGPESANLAQLLPVVDAFYAGELSQPEMDAFINQFSIDYVFWGPAEQDHGGWIPDPQHFQLVIPGEYAVYRVLQVSLVDAN